MSLVDPIRRREPIVPSPAKGMPRSAATAAKVHQIAQLPVVGQGGLRGRQVTLLTQANDLFKEIRNGWNALPPEALAGKIIDLENRVALLKEPSPAVDKIKKLAEHLHFQFVFPIAAELDLASSDKLMPITFARSVYKAAKQVFQTHSLEAFNRLNSVQKQQVIQIALRGQS